jgi:hypothetical protein
MCARMAIRQPTGIFWRFPAISLSTRFGSLLDAQIFPDNAVPNLP